jgi:multidrug efflux pump
MTLILAVVYIPIGFSSGMSGILFTEFALILSATVLISGVIALVLSPMLCAFILKNHTFKTGWMHHAMSKMLC